MPLWLKVIWVVAVAVNAVSLVWFLLGSTANFQRSLDITGIYLLILAWIPSLIIVLVSIITLTKGWNPSDSKGYAVIVFIILVLIYLAAHLFEGVETRGWLYDSINRDPIKITEDDKYEYRLELVNIRQRNGRTQLFVKNIGTGDEKYIIVDIDTTELRGWGSDRGDHWGWALMNPTDTPGRYELYTTENIGIPEQRFLIDAESGTSQRLE